MGVGGGYTVLMIKNFIIGLVVSSAFVFSYAQQTSTTSSKVVTLATVNIYNATTTQNGNDFTISFDLTNRVGVQPGVKYSVNLVQDTKNGQVMVDKHVYDEVINLGENSSVHKVVTYTPPAGVEGEYSLFISSKNSSGFPFGLASLGKVRFTRDSKNSNNPSVVIDIESCHLTVLGENGQPHYTSVQGVDIAKNEYLVSNCLVENRTSVPVALVPSFVTRARSNFGDIVPTVGGDTKSILLKPNEKIGIATVLPKGITPGAYNVTLAYGEGNMITYDYVMQGGSGTIQNLLLDKDNYKKGETANISFMWSGSADNFFDSRIGTGTKLLSTSFTISLFDELGKVCAEPLTQELKTGNELVKASVTLKKACLHPKADVVLTDAKLGELSKVSFATATTTPIKRNTSSILDKWLVLLILILVISILSTILKKRSVIPKISIFIMLIFAAYIPPEGVGVANADTISITSTYFDGNYDWPKTSTFTVNSNKTSYSVGENIQFSVTGNCGYPAYITVGGQGATCNPTLSTTLNVTANAEGNVPIFAETGDALCTKGMAMCDQYDSISYSFTYTVISAPTVNIFFSFLDKMKEFFGESFFDKVFAAK